MNPDTTTHAHLEDKSPKNPAGREPIDLYSLPPSELILLACRDTEEMMKDPRYLPREDQWHQKMPNEAGGQCMACFAGAVIRGHLGGADSPRRWFTPLSFEATTEKALKAIDHFRSGHIWAGLSSLGALDKPKIPNRRMPRFSAATMPEFLSAMRQLASDLRKAGL